MPFLFIFDILPSSISLSLTCNDAEIFESMVIECHQSPDRLALSKSCSISSVFTVYIQLYILSSSFHAVQMKWSYFKTEEKYLHKFVYQIMTNYLKHLFIFYF